MHPETLKEHIQKCKAATTKPFGVNVPLMYPNIEEIMRLIIDAHVPIVFTSAGSPKTWTKHLHEHGILVGHVVSNTTFALKSVEAGVDLIVAEGFEAGGHNGREETSTMSLIPQVRASTSKPLLAAGGISSRASYHAALALGADGVQLGTRFALSAESSAHPTFKDYCRNLKEGQTRLLLKQLSPTRLAENAFSNAVAAAEKKGASIETLSELLGRGRAKKGIFEGDLIDGALEIGQTAGSIRHEETVDAIFADLLE
jgi:enoyl-[acyl-carrier protein] reductase II